MDYWEKDIKKVRVEYRVDFVVDEPEKDSDVGEIESPVQARYYPATIAVG